MNPAQAKGWIDLLGSIVQSPIGTLIVVACLALLLGWLLVRFYMRDFECRVSHARLESMLAFVWGMLHQDERFSGKLPSFQAVKEGRVDLDSWMQSTAWQRVQDRRHDGDRRRAPHGS